MDVRTKVIYRGWLVELGRMKTSSATVLNSHIF